LDISAFEIPAGWEEPEEVTTLIERLKEERPNVDGSRIRHAYHVAEVAHQDQKRKSGEPYITHPLAVAHILAELRMDEDSIVAALLHDVLEDTPVTESQIRELFGEEVVALVQGVTKMRFPPLPKKTDGKIRAEERARFAETMRKMLLAMAADFRVMVIKLADRLHNMQTLDAMDEEKRREIAQQTLEVYAPIASRLGIWQIKWQLEDLAFKYLYPQDFEEVSEKVAKTRKQREREIQECVRMLKERLEAHDIVAEVQGRPKHLYSIYEKMKVHGFEFEEIYDLIGLRVIVDTEAQCYQALGIVHELWIPIPGLFYDYIAKPKPNGYQSLHTKVVGPHGEPLEVQIRTQEMHRMAEFGIASHWQYKSRSRETSIEDAIRLNKLRQQIFDWSKATQSGSDFLRSISMDLFGEQVFAFTPKGDVIDLPAGATPVDFAFRIHTQVGLHCVGAKVNGRIVKLDHPLENGDIVEVLTRRDAQPSVDWIRFCKTPTARSRIRAFLREQNREVNAQRGREALEREVRSMGLDPKEYLTEEKLKQAAEELRKKSDKDLLAAVGEGIVSVKRAISRIVGSPKTTRTSSAPSVHLQQTLTVERGAVDNVAFRRSKCCLPVPGDEVVGYISKGRGIILHRKLCPNAQALEQTDPERIVSVSWRRDGSQAYTTSLRIQTVNRQGLFADIANIFGESKTNVVSAKISTLPNQTALLEMDIDVMDRQHLQSVISRLSSLQDVISVQRTFSGKTKK
jgi:GTP pyrophosphokinase